MGPTHVPMQAKSSNQPQKTSQNMSSSLRITWLRNELNMFDHSVTISDEFVALEPMYLDRRILEHIRQKLRKAKVGICTKEYGYIQDIEIKKVTPTEISMADGGARFSTTYAIKSMLPKPGKVYWSKNVIIFNNPDMRCILATIDDTYDTPFQIFVMNGTVKDKKYKFDDCKCTVPVIKQGQPMDFVLIDIVVDTVEYHEKKFIVTGKHTHTVCKTKSSSKDDKEVRVKTEGSQNHE